MIYYIYCTYYKVQDEQGRTYEKEFDWKLALSGILLLLTIPLVFLILGV